MKLITFNGASYAEKRLERVSVGSGEPWPTLVRLRGTGKGSPVNPIRVPRVPNSILVLAPIVGRVRVLHRRII
jgi:hypothetical protein